MQPNFPNFPHIRPIVYCLIGLVIIQVTNARYVQVQNAHATYGPKHFTNFTVNVYKGALSVDFFATKALMPGFKAQLDYQIRHKNSKQYQRIFVHSFDVCKILGSLQNTMFKKWFRGFSKYSNFGTDKCPVAGGHYYMRNWTVASNDIPTFLYPGEYRVIGHGFYGKINTKSEDFVLEIVSEAKIT